MTPTSSHRTGRLDETTRHPNAGRPLRVSATTSSRSIRPPVTVPNRHLRDGTFGEAYLVWRCDECGETGPLTALPETCVSCGSGREALYYEIED